ncbi:uncharacterized protein LOC110456300 [Mizuhopecten yessoensis]|uniref:uncharacterized protein LOC110456300 n=1 Tax=Mizuhopecten yessoensis TaxID=6573 RepID=UPI000B45E41C|nr:uncharacterized protein LOC110456300 [Mizuhopecten yessoensis]
MAGLGETCSHIGALLFKMEAAVRLGYTRSACTDVSCVWNQCFTKNVQPAPIADIKFYNQSAKDTLVKKNRNKKALAPATDVEQQDFLRSLNTLDENLVGLSAFKEYGENFVGLGPPPEENKIPSPLRNIYNEKNNALSNEDLLELSQTTFDNMKISDEQVNYVEDITQSQSSSLTWHHQRSGRITASVAGEVMHTSVSQPSLSLLKKICIPSTSSPDVPALNWGKLHEEDAFKLYKVMNKVEKTELNICPKGEIILKNTQDHLSLNVKKAGFVISVKKPFLGASPDGHTFCECCGKGLLEIKCPYKIRDTKVKEALKDNTFCIDDTFSLKKTHKYFAQVQLQMFVCDGDYTDFVVWSPIDRVITRVQRDNNFINAMIEKLQNFWKLVVLPELLTRKVENSSGILSPSNRITINNNDKTFCVCKTKNDNVDMVGCDRCNDWFHPSCLKLKRLPKAKTWYCPKCRRQKKKK